MLLENFIPEVFHRLSQVVTTCEKLLIIITSYHTTTTNGEGQSKQHPKEGCERGVPPKKVRGHGNTTQEGKGAPHQRRKRLQLHPKAAPPKLEKEMRAKNHLNLIYFTLLCFRSLSVSLTSFTSVTSFHLISNQVTEGERHPKGRRKAAPPKRRKRKQQHPQGRVRKQHHPKEGPWGSFRELTIVESPRTKRNQKKRKLQKHDSENG